MEHIICGVSLKWSEEDLGDLQGVCVLCCVVFYIFHTLPNLVRVPLNISMLSSWYQFHLLCSGGCVGLSASALIVL